MAGITLQTVKVTRDLERFAVEVLPKDVQSAIQQIFLHELAVQKRLGAEPTSLLVDSGRGQISTVKRRAQAFFSNEKRLIQAVRETWDLLIQYTRVNSGKARAGYALYANQKLIGGREDIEAVAKALRPGDFMSVVGPGVPYGRVLYWNPIGKVRRKRKKVATGKDRQGKDVTVYAVSTEPLHAAVRRIIAGKYKDLVVSDQWLTLQHGTGMQGERWPAVSLAIKSANKGM